MNVNIITRANITKTPDIISFRNRLSNFMCMKKVITIATFIVAIIRAAVTEKAPRWILVTATEKKVSTSNAISTYARELKLEICG
jgi:hypothetical protein